MLLGDPVCKLVYNLSYELFGFLQDTFQTMSILKV